MLKQHICSICNLNQANPGYSWCQSCYISHIAETASKKSLCKNCNVNRPNPGYSWCQSCYISHIASKKSLCLICNLNPPNPGYFLCQSCYISHIACRKSLCLICNVNPPNPGYSLCQSCYISCNASKKPLCLICNVNPPNPGHSWCQSCLGVLIVMQNQLILGFRKEKNRPKKVTQCQTATTAPLHLKMYHGTSHSNLESILKCGLRCSTEGQLGRGVYLCYEEKAQNFARDAQQRGKGSGAVVLKCILRVRNIKKVNHSGQAGNWRTEGYDAVQCEKTPLSTKMEICVANSYKVQVIAWRYLSNGWTILN